MRRQFALLSCVAAMIVSVGCSETAIRVAPYDVVVLPSQFDFGAVAVGSQLPVVLVLTNQASGTAEIGNVTLGGSGGGHFVLPESFDGDLGGTATRDINLVFAPQAEGYWEDVLIISIVNNDDPDVVEVPIRGHGVTTALRAYPELLDFGPVDEDDSEDLDVFVENLTGVDLEIWGFDIDGDEDGFDVDDPIDFPVFPWIVPALGVLELTVVYESHDLDARDAGLTLLGPDGNEWGPAVELRANDCEGSAHPDWDNDDDGITQCAGDCDDDDPLVNPALAETPDLLDNDCNGLVDDTTELYDDDGDGQSEAEGDCNDANDTTYSGAEEVADGQDNDCDGDVDEGTTADDSDGDGYTIPGGDCDDADPTSYPSAVEG